MRRRTPRFGGLLFGVAWGAIGTASAQTSVTLYGVVDAGVEYANHQAGSGNSVVRMATGNITGSRWGMRGTEKLGNSLNAVFVLESGFDPDTGKSGQGSRLFGRNAYVGLNHATYGALLLGRQINGPYELSLNYDPMVLAPKYSILTMDASYAGRADNTVKYVGKFGAISTSAFYSLGADSSVVNGSEVPGNPKLGRELGGFASYDVGQASFAAAYDEINTGTLTVNPDAKARRATAAATYAVGDVKLYAGYRWARAFNGGVITGSIAGAANQGSSLYWTGAIWQITPAISFTGAAYYQDFKNTSSDPWLFVAMADYAFSKRTRAYISTAYTKNKGTSNLGVYDGGKSFGNTNPGMNQFAAVAGIRTNF